MLGGYIEKPNGFLNFQVAQCRGPMSLPPKGPSQAVQCGFNRSDKQVDNMPRSCSTNVLSEEQPAWLEDLLNEPEIPVNKAHHRRSASDPFAYLDANTRVEELWLRNMMGGPPTWAFQVPPYTKGFSQASSNRRPSSNREQRDKPRLPNGLTSTKEDAEFKALGLSCSPPEQDRVAFVGSEMQNQGDNNGSHNSENSSGGSDNSQMKPSVLPSASKTDVKRKQHNARRSRVRKLQYIAELERSLQALQVEGAEVAAQLEFLDQQNLILGMENRALKQRLESLSQAQLIKSMEQDILDRELGRLQYLYRLQNLNHNHHQQQRHRQKHNPAVHRRVSSCDLDSQLAKLSLNHPDQAIVLGNGFKDLPHRK